MDAPDGAGNQPRIGGEILIDTDVDQGGVFAVPMRRESLSGDIEV